MLVVHASTNWQLNYIAYVFDLVLLISADVDECKIPSTCNEICHNTEGSHYCTECPSKTVYDAATMMCKSSKEPNVGLGEFYGKLYVMSYI